MSYNYTTGQGQIWVGAKLPPTPGHNMLWLKPSEDHLTLWEIRAYNQYKATWEVITSAAFTAEGLLKKIEALSDRIDLLEDGAVLYSEEQDLTEIQQVLARANIGAISKEDLPDPIEIVQDLGDSTTAVMSQRAVTEAISEVSSEGTVRYDEAQDLTTSEQNQALENIGADLMVIDLVNGQAVLTEEQEARLLSCKGVILRGTVNASKEVLTKIYFSDYQGGDTVNFFAIRNNEFCLRCSYTKSTKIFKFNTGVRWSNPTYVSVYSPQNFSMSEQAQAWSNLGLDLVVLKFPEGATSVVLTDEEDAKLRAGAAVLLTVDGTNTGVGIYNADNHIFTSPNFVSVPEPIFYSLWSNTLALYCSYKKASKTFVFNGNLFLNDLGALRFDRPTSLTTSQQDTALSNIGLPLVHVDYSLIGSTLDDSTYNKLLTAKGVFLENVPDGNNAPSLYFVGSSNTVTTTFVSEFNARLWFQMTLSHTLKKLSLISTGYATDVVRYGESQNLTDAQKAQARANIGVESGGGSSEVHITESDLHVTLSDEKFAEISAASRLVLTMGEYTIPLDRTVWSDTETNPIWISQVAHFAEALQDGQIPLTFLTIKLDLITKILIVGDTAGELSGYVRSDVDQALDNTDKARARANINAIGSTSIKGVEVVYGTAPTAQDDIIYIELEQTT